MHILQHFLLTLTKLGVIIVSRKRFIYIKQTKLRILFSQQEE